jgi:hypothetical protein
MLAHPHYVNAPLECVARGLTGTSEFGAGAMRESTIFYRHNANEPSDEKARWIMERLYGLLNQTDFKARNPGRTPVLKNVFRRDLFDRVKAVVHEPFTSELGVLRSWEPSLAQ